MQAPVPLLNTITLPPGATNTQARLVLDGVRGAIFLYQNGGPVGALILSIARSAGTDPYGNTYPAGISTSVGSISGATIIGSTIESSSLAPGVKIDSSGDIIVYNSHGAIVYYLSPSHDGFFVYADTGSATQGALIGSWAGKSGTDPVNATSYPQGIYITQGEITGTDYIINSSGAFFYNGTPTTGNLAISITTSIGTDGFSNAYDAGVTVYPANALGAGYGVNYAGEYSAGGMNGGGASGTVQVQSGATTASDSPSSIILQSKSASGGSTPAIVVDGVVQLLPQTSTPSAPPLGGGFYSNVNSTPAAITPAGEPGTLPLVQTDTSTNTNANLSGSHALSVAENIEANDAQVGTIYEIEMPIQIIFETQSLELGISVNGSATYEAAFTIPAGGFAAGDNITGILKATIQVLTTGASGTANFFMNGILYDHTGAAPAVVSGQNLANAFNTTVTNNVRFGSIWGAAAAGQTVSGYGCRFTRYGP
jgi:hypothetical protein